MCYLSMEIFVYHFLMEILVLLDMIKLFAAILEKIPCWELISKVGLSVKLLEIFSSFLVGRIEYLVTVVPIPPTRNREDF